MKRTYILLSFCALITAPYITHTKPSEKDTIQLYKTILQLDALFQYNTTSFDQMKKNLTTIENETITSSFPVSLGTALDDLLHNDKNTGYLDILYKPASVYSEKGLSKEEAFDIYEQLKAQYLNKNNNKPIDQAKIRQYIDEKKGEGTVKGSSIVYPVGALHAAREESIQKSLSTSWQKRYAIIILRYFANKLLSYAKKSATYTSRLEEDDDQPSRRPAWQR